MLHTDPRLLDILAMTRRDGECLLWTGTPGSRGYGRVRVGGRWQRTHRTVFMLAHGPIPPGLVVRHSCDRPACVNPSHLGLGTQRDNVRDMHERGRARSATGPANSKTKLTATQAAEIRARFVPYDRCNGARALAREFDVAHASITAIVAGISHAAAGGPAKARHNKHSHKLTPDAVREIRRRYMPRSKTSNFDTLAREFGVSKCAIEDVVKGVTWRHVK